MLVLAIIAVAASMAVSRYGTSAGHHGLQAAASRMVADLDLARRKALALGSARTVTFEKQAGSYTLDDVPDLNRAGQAYRVDLKSAPYQVALRSVDVDGAGGSVLTFDAYGRPVPAATAANPQEKFRVVMSCAAGTATVLIEPLSGRAYVQP